MSNEKEKFMAAYEALALGSQPNAHPEMVRLLGESKWDSIAGALWRVCAESAGQVPDEWRTLLAQLANGLEVMTKLAAERAGIADEKVCSAWVQEARNLLASTQRAAFGARLERAERALLRAGFQDHGGQDWTPPLGQPPRFIADTAPDPVVEANRQLLLDRSRVGVAKYGTTLADANLTRDELVRHALEEALDLANYLQALLKC